VGPPWLIGNDRNTTADRSEQGTNRLHSRRRSPDRDPQLALFRDARSPEHGRSDKMLALLPMGCRQLPGQVDADRRHRYMNCILLHGLENASFVKHNGFYGSVVGQHGENHRHSSHGLSPSICDERTGLPERLCRRGCPVPHRYLMSALQP
jgi:hypothetical protein